MISNICPYTIVDKEVLLSGLMKKNVNCVIYTWFIDIWIMKLISVMIDHIFNCSS